MTRVLYFEDNEYFLGHVKEMLWRYHHKVDHYETPNHFLEKQKEGKVSLLNYDILITDLFLPYEVSGTDFVKKHILKKGLKLPIVFYTDLNPATIKDETGIKKPNVVQKIFVGELEDKIKGLLKK